MSEKKRNIIGIVLFLFFAVLFIIGAFEGEAFTVINKAIKICMECIGIG